MTDDTRYARFNDYLKSHPDEAQAESEKARRQADDDFKELAAALADGRCSMCGQLVSHFSEKKPCLHWLLKPNGFKKKHFPLLYERYDFHRMNWYVRWVANTAAPLRNINDLAEDRAATKFIEETIRHENIEWSFSCSHGDRTGHAGSHAGAMPHYHFQMTVDRNVVINYSGFHVPFSDHDEFVFAVKAGKVEVLQHHPGRGAGMQTLFDSTTAEGLIDHMTNVDSEADSAFNVSTMILAREGSKLSGDDLAALIEESKRTGVPIAKLAQRLPNANVQSIVSPGRGVPEIAARAKRKKK